MKKVELRKANNKLTQTQIKKQNGITLVALVITIIILLILAGISIQALSQQGLFGQAKRAKSDTENAQISFLMISILLKIGGRVCSLKSSI